MNWKALMLLAPGLFLGAAGCVKLDKPNPGKRQFALDARRVGAPAETRLADMILKVRRFDVAPQYGAAELVYRIGDAEYAADYYNVFFVPPADLLTQAVRQWLADSGRFEQVPDAASRLPATHTLEGNVTALYGDFRGQPAAVMEIQFALLDEAGPRPGLGFSKTYTRSIPIAADQPPELVKGWNQALGEILGELEPDLGNIRSKAP